MHFYCACVEAGNIEAALCATQTVEREIIEKLSYHKNWF